MVSATVTCNRRPSRASVQRVHLLCKFDDRGTRVNVSSETTDLLPRVAEGDEGAMHAVIDRYSGLVWSLARRKLQSRTDAEDAVQEIFLEVWKSAGRFKASLGSEDTFIATIARRRLIDRIRKLSRAPDEVSSEEALAQVSRDVEGASARAAEIGEEARAALDTFGSLRPERQTVLHLAVCSGLSHSQIAAATGMPLGTVKTHVRRGLAEIRRALEGESEEVEEEVSS